MSYRNCRVPLQRARASQDEGSEHGSAGEAQTTHKYSLEETPQRARRACNAIRYNRNSCVFVLLVSRGNKSHVTGSHRPQKTFLVLVNRRTRSPGSHQPVAKHTRDLEPLLTRAAKFSESTLGVPEGVQNSTTMSEWSVNMSSIDNFTLPCEVLQSEDSEVWTGEQRPARSRSTDYPICFQATLARLASHLILIDV